MTANESTIKRDAASVDKLRSALEPPMAMLTTGIQAVYLHGSWGSQSALKARRALHFFL